MNPIPTLHFGWVIESDAESALLRLGWKILRRNYRIRLGEIDLIAEESREEGRELVFVEVRARRKDRNQFTNGLESVTRTKQIRIERTAQYFLTRSYRGQAKTIRFDVMAWDGTHWEHTRGAW